MPFMKYYLIAVSLLLVTCVCAQTQPLVSKVYTLDNTPAAKTKTGATKKIFSGSGGILALHEMNELTILKGKTSDDKANTAGNERFFIVSKGQVTMHLNNKSYVVERGSIAVVLPGDQFSIENTGTDTAKFYTMHYRSIKPVDLERGKKAGPSFVMNWNDMVAKPTDKGSTRQLFDRQTAMLNRCDIHVTTLNQGFKSHDPHTHTNEEIILMLEGNAEMQIGEDHQKANAGDVVLLNSMVLHNLTNIGKTACVYFAIQWN